MDLTFYSLIATQTIPPIQPHGCHCSLQLAWSMRLHPASHQSHCEDHWIMLMLFIIPYPERHRAVVHIAGEC